MFVYNKIFYLAGDLTKPALAKIELEVSVDEAAFDIFGIDKFVFELVDEEEEEDDDEAAFVAAR